MSYCRPRRGMRSTTSPPRICTRSCTPSTRRSRRRGRPSQIGTPFTGSRRSSPPPPHPTDLHPFVLAFNGAIAPPWEAKSDWDAFHRIAKEFSRLAERHLGKRRDLVAAPLLHDTPDEIAQPLGEVRDWRAGECEPVPGRTMPKLLVIERDYPHVAEQWAALGPLLDELGSATKGASWKPLAEIAELRSKNGAVRGGLADGRPSLERVEHACEAILALSGTCNGRLAVEGFRSMEKRTGVPRADLAAP